MPVAYQSRAVTEPQREKATCSLCRENHLFITYVQTNDAAAEIAPRLYLPQAAAASNSRITINRRRKALRSNGFRAKQHFEDFQNTRRMKLSKKAAAGFFDKLIVTNLSQCYPIFC